MVHFQEQNGDKILLYRVLTLHADQFNATYSKSYLAPTKEILGMLTVGFSFAAIRYRTQLHATYFIIVVFLAVSSIFSYTTTSNSNKENLAIRKSMRPFGIQIGSFYIFIKHTILTVLGIILT